MAASLYNLARMTTGTTGAGTITLGSAVSGFLSFSAAGVSDGETVTYAIQDGTASEIGRGVYTASGTTLTRSVLKSTNSNAAISLSGSAQVFITAAAEDFSVRTTAETEFGADNRIVRSDGTGRGVQSSLVSVDDSGNIQGINNVTGSGTNLVTGTAGTADHLIAWDGNGDAVDAGFAKTALTSMSVQVFTSSGTWTKPSGLRYAFVLVVGGGGGGGGVTGNSTDAIGGGGGGGGGSAASYIAAGSLGGTETVTVGAGGTGGASGSSSGTGGGTSSFGSHLTATGGSVGTSRTASASYPAADPGSPGSGASGNIFNSVASPATSWFYPLSDPISGNGGGSIVGGGGRGRTAPSSPGYAAGIAASSYGGGGGGAVVKAAGGSSSAAGGNGKSGLVVVFEFY